MPDKPRHPTPTEQAAMDARPEPDASGDPAGMRFEGNQTEYTLDKQQPAQRHELSQDCGHYQLSFNSGDYYLICEGCGRQWVLRGETDHGDPERCIPNFFDDYKRIKRLPLIDRTKMMEHIADYMKSNVDKLQIGSVFQEFEHLVIENQDKQKRLDAQAAEKLLVSQRLRDCAYELRTDGASFKEMDLGADALDEAADALDAQAAEIAELTRRADNQDRWARKYRAEAALTKQQNAALRKALDTASKRLDRCAGRLEFVAERPLVDEARVWAEEARAALEAK